MVRSKQGGGRNSEGLRVVWMAKGSRGRKPWQQVSPPWQLRCTLFPLCPTFLSKNIRFFSGMRLSRETGFPALNPPTSFLRVSLPTRYEPSPSTGPHIYRSSTKWCTPLGCRMYRCVTLRGGGTSLTAYSQTVFYEYRLIKTFEFSTVSFSFNSFFLFQTFLGEKSYENKIDRNTIDLLRKI